MMRARAKEARIRAASGWSGDGKGAEDTRLVLCSLPLAFLADLYLALEALLHLAALLRAEKSRSKGGIRRHPTAAVGAGAKARQQRRRLRWRCQRARARDQAGGAGRRASAAKARRSSSIRSLSRTFSSTAARFCASCSPF